ncbi:uncharacterized protein BJ212DRAFT_1268627, partial [Suillus subaureus]
SYHIIIKNVPTSYNPSSICTNSDIETNIRLKPGTITKAKWIKLIARHKAMKESTTKLWHYKGCQVRVYVWSSQLCLGCYTLQRQVHSTQGEASATHPQVV